MFSDAILPMLCYSHLTKNLRDDIDKAYDDLETRRVISSVVGRIFSLTSIDRIKEHLKLVITLIGAPKKTEAFVSVIHYHTM